MRCQGGLPCSTLPDSSQTCTGPDTSRFSLAEASNCQLRKNNVFIPQQSTRYICFFFLLTLGKCRLLLHQSESAYEIRGGSSWNRPELIVNSLWTSESTCAKLQIQNNSAFQRELLLLVQLRIPNQEDMPSLCWHRFLISKCCHITHTWRKYELSV